MASPVDVQRLLALEGQLERLCRVLRLSRDELEYIYAEPGPPLHTMSSAAPLAPPAPFRPASSRQSTASLAAPSRPVSSRPSTTAKLRPRSRSPLPPMPRSKRPKPAFGPEPFEVDSDEELKKKTKSDQRKMPQKVEPKRTACANAHKDSDAFEDCEEWAVYQCTRFGKKSPRYPAYCETCYRYYLETGQGNIDESKTERIFL